MEVCITIDMEQDCPPYFSTYRGIEEGTPRLLSLLDEEKIRATFFTTGDVARRYPQTVRQIVSKNHELGCHGDTHQRFDQMDPETAKAEIVNSTRVLRQFFPVTSFRAPNLVFPNSYLRFLESAGYKLDSSEARYKRAYHKKNGRPKTQLVRIPASVTSSVLRLPKWIRYPWLNRLKKPVVLFVHPWEFVDLTKEKLRLDCRFKTGQPALDCLRENIRFLKEKNASFLRMKDLAA